MSRRAKNKRANDNKKAVVEVKPLSPAELHQKRINDIRVKTQDGFANFTSRLGVGQGVDNQLSQGMFEFNLLTRNRIQLEAAYRGSWVVGMVCDAIAEDMTKAGVDITTSEAAKDVQELQAGLKKLGVWNSLCDIIKWARLYGGAIGVLQIEGQELSSPLIIERISKGQFKGITVYDRWQVQPSLTEVIPSGPDLGLPAFYNIITTSDLASANVKQGNDVTGSIKVHHSRVVRQIGIKLPFFQAVTENGWGMSVVERLYDRLISFDTATMSAANLINHAHLRTVGVDGLREIMAAGGAAEEGLIKMFEYMRLLQSNEGITLLDKNDMFATTSYTFAGLSDMLLQFGQQLSGASGIPLVRFFGQAPAGLNSTGESDFKNYYGNVNALQEANLRSPVEKILKVTYKSMFGKDAPSDMSFLFTSLWQMSATDKATVASTTTTTVINAFESGLVNRKVSLQELRSASPETGLFTSITDEEIAEAEGDEPPMPNQEMETELNDKIKTTDSKFMKSLSKLLTGK